MKSLFQLQKAISENKMLRWTTCAQPDGIDAGIHSDNRHSKKWPKDRSRSVSQEVKYRVVVLGAVGVGKTTIIRRYLCSCVRDELEDLPSSTNSLTTTTGTTLKPMPTTTIATSVSGWSAVAELHRAHYDVDDTRLTLEVLEVRDNDTKGPEWQAAVASGDAFVIVYSVDNDESLEAVSRLRTEVLKRNTYLHPPIVIVANKTDTAGGTRHMQNVIAEMVAVVDWGHGYVATSAVEDLDSLKAIFLQLFRQVQFPPDHAMNLWLDLHHTDTSRQRKRAGTFSRLSQRVRKLMGGPQ